MAGPDRIAVIGLGKIGLPLAAQFAGKGAIVTGCDVSADRVSAVNEGKCPINGEPGLAEALAAGLESGRLSATTETTDAVQESNVVVIVVPVAIDGEHKADFSNLDAAAEAVGRGLTPGTLVVLETTVPVGATRGRLKRRLMAASGLHGDGDFRLAYSPERVSSGSVFRDLSTYPKLLAGADEPSAAAATAFYRAMLDADVLTLPDLETAEFTKLAESIYRDVNIALANELAQAAEYFQIDYATAAAAANSQPYSHLHAPGLGVGGHCIPVYPYFLIDAGEQRLAMLARRVNDSMAYYAVDLLEDAFKAESGRGLQERSVLILGLAYRGGVKEATLSSALLVAAALEERGARVLVNDPLFSEVEIAGLGLISSPLPPRQPVDAVVLQAAHPEYRDFDVGLLQGCLVLLDGRRALDRARVEAAGIRYLAVGLGR